MPHTEPHGPGKDSTVRSTASRALWLGIAPVGGGFASQIALSTLGAHPALALAAGVAVGGGMAVLLARLAARNQQDARGSQASADLELGNLRRALDHAPAGILLTDPHQPDQPIVYANRGFLELTGYARDEVLGRNCRFLNQQDRDQPQIDALRRAAERREPINLVLRNRRKDGSPFWNDLTMAPVPGADGTVARMVGVQIDRSAEMEQAAALEASVEAAEAHRREAEILGRARDRQFSFVSHELRTPLNAMHAWLSVLSSSRVAATRERAVEVLERNLALQSRLVNDLIDASRITAGKLALDRRRCDLAEVVQLVARSESPVAEDHGIELHLEGPPRGVPVIGDFERLLQAISNLIGNAVKFTDEGGRIDLALASEGKTARVSVTDTGRGISAEVLPHVFDLYKQEGAAPAAEQRGLGLGLAIVAHIVEQHGGSVRAHSPGLGKGSRFEIRIPIAEGAAAAPEEAPEPSLDLLAGVHVLIADTNRLAAEALAVTLEEAGARVDWVGNETTAVSVAGASAPDVFVCGLEARPATDLLGVLRARTQGLRALALVDARSGDLRSRLKRAGFDAAMRRALPPAEIRGRIIDLLGRQPAILLIDDDHDSADSLAILLRRRGFEVSVAYGFEQAVQRAEDLDLNLVVTDMSLPDGDGLELARRLRVLGARRIVALSGRSESEFADADTALDGYVRKPVDLDALLAALAGD